MIVKWPDDRISITTDVPVNQTLTLYQKEALTSMEPPRTSTVSETVFQEIHHDLGIDFKHRENDFIDFDRDRLIYHMLSTQGPKICKADVNGDGLEDFFIGGAKNSAGQLFLQLPGGKFSKTNNELWEADKISEDVDCIFFDADTDGDMDLYVASGGNEFSTSSSSLLDRLYINDGSGGYSKSKQFLPTNKFESTGCVKAADYDMDGDQDLFVGIRLRPFLYGVPVNGYILNNDGSGNFTNVTPEVAPELQDVGMITDGLWTDLDGDRDMDLVVVGDWMPIKIFRNDFDPTKENAPTSFTEISDQLGLANTNGFWNCIKSGDFDKDGDQDFVVGNHGLNTRIKFSLEKPATMYVNDFDRNGQAEQIICTYNGDRSYPLALKHDLVMQMPNLKNKYLKYESYKEQTIHDIFTPEQINSSIQLKAFQPQSCIIINRGDRMELKELPLEAQFSPIYGLMVDDFDKDGYLDILMGGNFYSSKPELGIYDASYGLLLKGNWKNSFQPIHYRDSGFFTRGEIRDFVTLVFGNEKLLLVAKNHDYMQIFKY